jgi:hypothetical protein
MGFGSWASAPGASAGTAALSTAPPAAFDAGLEAVGGASGTTSPAQPTNNAGSNTAKPKHLVISLPCGKKKPPVRKLVVFAFNLLLVRDQLTN